MELIISQKIRASKGRGKTIRGGNISRRVKEINARSRERRVGWGSKMVGRGGRWGGMQRSR
jgi:hypothetical protein